ncbi:MAG TPA: MBL fold metallo-hydrolase [Pedobacter sp.]|nr:MBL fold metallo-hydrolase [Pedobacter sp.]
MPEIYLTHIDTACVLLEIDGFRILTDPTLDAAGGCYYHGFGAISRKTNSAPPIGLLPEDIDLVLLTHHQHMDNFDVVGREFTSNCRLVISTTSAAKAIPKVKGLENWESLEVRTQKLNGLKITATPAQHRPWWIPEWVSGKVIGFIIEFEGQQDGVIYISGDTVYFKGIEEVGRRYRVDIGIFHVGSVQFRYLTGFGKYTMDGSDLLKVIRVLVPRLAIPVHFDGWSHFQEREPHLRKVLSLNPAINKLITFLKNGERTKIK